MLASIPEEELKRRYWNRKSASLAESEALQCCMYALGEKTGPDTLRTEAKVYRIYTGDQPLSVFNQMVTSISGYMSKWTMNLGTYEWCRWVDAHWCGVKNPSTFMGYPVNMAGNEFCLEFGDQNEVVLTDPTPEFIASLNRCGEPILFECPACGEKQKSWKPSASTDFVIVDGIPCIDGNKPHRYEICVCWTCAYICKPEGRWDRPIGEILQRVADRNGCSVVELPDIGYAESMIRWCSYAEELKWPVRDLGGRR